MSEGDLAGAGDGGQAGAAAEAGDVAGPAGRAGQSASAGGAGIAGSAGKSSADGNSGAGGGPVGDIVVDSLLLAVGKTYVPYSATITASGAVNYTWSLQSGALPAGVSLLDSTKAAARLAGTPTEAGLFPFVLSVTDGARTSSFNGTLSVTHPVVFLADRRALNTQEL